MKVGDAAHDADAQTALFLLLHATSIRVVLLQVYSCQFNAATADRAVSSYCTVLYSTTVVYRTVLYCTVVSTLVPVRGTGPS